MPEGDTIFRAAATLRKALAGRAIVRFETSVDSVRATERRYPVVGRIVQAVEPRGKHLLMVFRERTTDHGPQTTDTAMGRQGDAATGGLLPSDLVLHTHMRMTGSWHIYRPGEAWRKPARLAVVTIYTDAFVAPCFSAPVVELLTAREAARHPDLVTLGPDAMTDDFDAEEARFRIRKRPDLPIGVALMNQRAMAGVGNVYKSEVLFIRRVSPFALVRDLSDEALDGLIEESRSLMRLNAERGGRRTIFGLDDRQRLWVYGRSGEPCRVCGTPIRMRRQGLDGRSTYYCPNCQRVD